ncbi:EAL domain-containing protein [Methylotenera sp.]|uniref:EAL domain-containing protein n=1 Tax=Methylotenera sp. TaxID=2051956 RepID=UPI00248925F7|nr:EAL domain-containing protein [Methylotenera sp.]MDI1299039.1 EAL domain-containing protein [Methylotenera sp.]
MLKPENSVNESARLTALARYEVLDTVSEQEFDDITLLASQICEVPIALISLVDGDRQWFKSRVGLDATETPRDISFCGHAIHGNTLFEVSNALDDSRFADNPLVSGAPDIRFYAGMPIITSDGLALGTLCVIDSTPHTLSSKQRDTLAVLARQVMRLLESRIASKKILQLSEEVNQKAIFKSVLLASAADSIISTTPDGVILTFNQAAERLLGYKQEELVGLYTPAIFHDADEIVAKAIELSVEFNETITPGFEVFVHKARNGVVDINEWTYVNKRGDKVSVRLAVSAMRDEQNNIIGYIGIASDISERKSQEYAIFTATSQLEASLEAIPDLVWMKNMDGVFLRCNRSFERFLGSDKPNVIGKTDYDFFDKESADFFRLHDRKAANQDFPLITEEWLTFNDGYYGLFEVTKTGIKDNAGSLIGTLGIAHDITERKSIESKLRRQREAMQALNDISSQTIQVEYEKQLREALAVACKYLGMEYGILSKIQGESCFIDVQVSPPDTIYDGLEYPFEDTYSSLLFQADGILFVEQMKNSRYSNHRCYALMGFESFIGLPLLLDGNRYGLILLSKQAQFNSFDVTVIDFVHLFSRLVVNLIRRNNLSIQIAKGNERLDLALQSASLGLWDLDVPTGQTFYNARWAEMLGYELSEIEQTLDAFEGLLHPDDKAEVLAALQAHFNGETSDFSLEFRMLHKDGSWIWVYDHGRVMERSADGTPIRVLGTHMDISKRKATELIVNSNAELLRRTNNMAKVGGWEFNLATSSIYWSEGIKRIHEVDDDYVPEMNKAIEFYTPESKPIISSAVNSAIENGVSWDLELEIITAKNNHKWVRAQGNVEYENAKITRLVGVFQDITQQKLADDAIKKLAFYDVLTQLPNRRLLLDRLDRALLTSARSLCYGALVFIDLDNFKTLNDTLGHDMGDALLKQVATRLQACLRDCDTVARFGGDEFVVMLDNLDTDSYEAKKLVETVGAKIIQALNQPYEIVPHGYYSTPSLGATIFVGKSDTVDEALKRADIAMYQAKSAGRNCLRFFDPEIQANADTKAILVDALRHGIGNNQFVLHYQPQVNRTGVLTGAEALVRWNHPQQGMISPLEFIPLAEEMGLILPLGKWVLETGCKQLVTWAGSAETEHLNLSINVSARQFHQPDFVAQVLDVLSVTNVNPQRLKLELTESMLVDDMDDVISKMTLLQAAGIRFSLDDFGTGFSSLSYLKQLPLYQLKIDKSFVQDVLSDQNDAVIARTIVALASSLGLSVIAEGVEIEGQREFLEGIGCYEYQGYLFSRPLSIEDFDAYRKALQKIDIERLLKSTSLVDAD